MHTIFYLPRQKKAIWRLSVRKNASGLCIVNHLLDLDFKILRKELDMLLSLVFPILVNGTTIKKAPSQKARSHFGFFSASLVTFKQIGRLIGSCPLICQYSLHSFCYCPMLVISNHFHLNFFVNLVIETSSQLVLPQLNHSPHYRQISL